MASRVAQGNHALLKLPDEPLQGVVRDIGWATIPRHHQAILVQQQTEFAPNKPPLLRKPLAADLWRAAAFAPGMEQLDAIRVDDAEPGWRGQAGLGPALMRPEEAQEPGARGEVRAPGTLGLGQPTLARAIADAFEAGAH